MGYSDDNSNTLSGNATMPDAATVRLSLPRQELGEFTRFRLTALDAAEWARGLPVIRGLDAAQQLLDALSELNRYPHSPELRFNILQALESSVEAALRSLGKRYLNQPLVMPPAAQAHARLGNQLLAAAASGYTVATVEAIRQRDSLREMNPARLACESIQRALCYHGRRTLLAFQLYRPVDMLGWQTLHQLYALAERQQLHELSLPGQPGDAHTTITSTYLQTLLLSCCKPNQLRQGDMAAIFQALESWAAQASLSATDRADSLFLVDLNSDQPPLYSSLYSGDESSRCRFIHTTQLVAQLRQLRAERETAEASTAAAGALPTHLLDHLITALGQVNMRNFRRNSSRAPLQVCLGLSSTHYRVADSREFDTLVRGNEQVIRAREARGQGPRRRVQGPPDLWQQANPGDTDTSHDESRKKTSLLDEIDMIDLDAATRASLLGEAEDARAASERYAVFTARLADASPGGYCLEWTRELPDSVHTGDIVGIREEQGQHWMIAAIRWLSRLQPARTLLGLELLSPRALAYGAMIHQRDGSKLPPLRALLLPAIELVGQPDTLITPRAAFRERQRVTLVRGSETSTIQLLAQVAASPGYSQFEFRFVRELGDLLADKKNGLLDSPYDSLWNQI